MKNTNQIAQVIVRNSLTPPINKIRAIGYWDVIVSAGWGVTLTSSFIGYPSGNFKQNSAARGYRGRHYDRRTKKVILSQQGHFHYLREVACSHLVEVYATRGLSTIIIPPVPCDAMDTSLELSVEKCPNLLAKGVVDR
jgi:hypothetical protein